MLAISIFLTLFVAQAKVPVEAKQVPDLKKLRDKYVFQSIYLTYIPLHSLTLLLNEDEKYDKLLQDPLWKDALPVLKKYLNDNQRPELNRAIAFLQLDLGNLQAGVKSMSDRGAEITKLPWEAATVIGVSLFSDRYLSGQLKADEAASAIAKGKYTVAEAWGELGVLKNDPFVPSQTLGKPLQDFQKLVEGQPEEMKKLQKQDKNLHDKIQRFRLGFRPTMRERELHVEEWTTLSTQFKLLDRRATLRDADAVEMYFKALGETPPVVAPKGDKPPSIGSIFNPP